MKKYDAIIIGFGKGGKTLASALGAAGKQVAVIEQSEKMYGGTCINVGCIPSKSLMTSAKQSAMAGGGFLQKSTRYQAAVVEKNRLTAMLRDKNYHKLADHPNITVLHGRASFAGPKTVEVESAEGRHKLEAEQIFINTGARPFLPPIPGLKESKRAYFSEALMDLEELPENLVIIGGGYIGIEFASMYANFGAKVIILQDGPTFLPREDNEIASEVLKTLQQRGIEVVYPIKVKQVSDLERYTEISIETESGERILKANAVLVAAGRRPNTESLNTHAAGVELTSRGAVKVDALLRTTAPAIWAMGDVCGGLQFTYISLDDYRIVKSQVLGDGGRSQDNRGAVPYSVFLDPPFSRVGMTEQEARDKGYSVKLARLAVAAIPKAQVLKETTGLLKAVIDAETGLILGAHLYCPESHEMINLLKLAIDTEQPYTALRDNIYTHPTLSEALNDLFSNVE